MGNYSGRIRCGYCYEYGHNSRTCPEKKKRLEAEAAERAFHAAEAARLREEAASRADAMASALGLRVPRQPTMVS